MIGHSAADHLRRTARAPLEIAVYLALTPSWLLMALLLAMMFTPPYIPQPPPVDRLAFFAVALVGGLYLLPRLRSVNWREPLIWSIAALAMLAVFGGHSFGRQTWSMIAAKFAIPGVVFVISACVFRYQPALRRFFVFLLCLQTYLVVVSILSLLNLDALLFPRYIADSSLGTHATRARGPFLQAVANGTALSILGLSVFYIYLKGICRTWALVILVLTPVAILATLTRGVWLGFIAAVLVLLGSRTADRRLRVVFFLFAVATAGAAVGLLAIPELSERVFARAGAEDPVDVRIALYKASIDMFVLAPWFGWGTNEIAQQIGPFLVPYGFNPDVISPHNTYLEILVEHGVIGFGLYLLVLTRLFFIGRHLRSTAHEGGLIDRQFLPFWRAALVAYLVNAIFVVMTYDFINGLLFMIAGVVAGAEWRTRAAQTAVGRPVGLPTSAVYQTVAR